MEILKLNQVIRSNACYTFLCPGIQSPRNLFSVRNDKIVDDSYVNVKKKLISELEKVWFTAELNGLISNHVESRSLIRFSHLSLSRLLATLCRRPFVFLLDPARSSLWRCRILNNVHFELRRQQRRKIAWTVLGT